MKKSLLGAAFVLALVTIANAAYVTVPAYLKKSEDTRNDKVALVAHMRWGVDPTTLILDLLSVSPTASMADVDRSVFDTADALSGRSFASVQLAYRGFSKFQMDGAYFKKLGEERSYQNPVYTIRTLPENMKDMNGLPAFQTWTGGMLGVMTKQMEDHNNLHHRWYIADIMKSR